ncbi:MAG: CoA pyrophosphatase [Sulfolobales archaeon]
MIIDPRILLEIYELLDENSCGDRDYDAAVALIYNPTSKKILLIERREIEGDPWSGHIAFPGGRRESHDRSSFLTSLRELEEEIKIDRSKLIHLGSMKIHVTRGSVRVAPHIYIYTSNDENIEWSSNEVKTARWVPIEDIREIECPSDYKPRCFRTSYFGKIVWGLTGRILGEFLGKIKTAEDLAR